jgi:hypothetical protein
MIDLDLNTEFSLAAGGGSERRGSGHRVVDRVCGAWRRGCGCGGVLKYGYDLVRGHVESGWTALVADG